MGSPSSSVAYSAGTVSAMLLGISSCISVSLPGLSAHRLALRAKP